MLVARREEIDWVHSEGAYEIVPMQECRDAGMKPLDVIWVDTQVCGSDTQENSIEVVCKRIQKMFHRIGPFRKPNAPILKKHPVFIEVCKTSHTT